MTNKEWLKNITPKDLDLNGNVLLMLDGSVLMMFEDYYSLIEQAKLVQELEQQNKRYREALSIISANLPLDGREHYVDIARQALEVEGEMNEVCPICNGSGGIDVLDYSIGEVVTIPCPDCGGSGEATDVTRKALEESK